MSNEKDENVNVKLAFANAGVDTDVSLRYVGTPHPHIEPEVGRVMLYRPNGTTGMADNDRAKVDGEDRQPMAATVAYVHGGGKTVNLSVVDHYGNQFGAPNVPVIQDGYAPPAPGSGAYCHWMPYQVEQARRTESTFLQPVDNGGARPV